MTAAVRGRGRRVPAASRVPCSPPGTRGAGGRPHDGAAAAAHGCADYVAYLFCDRRAAGANPGAAGVAPASTTGIL
ncbi:hypothetical protein GCM10027570_06110 [Streptomonospora sediminis]